MKFQRSFTFRITVWYLLVLVGVMGLLCTGVYLHVSHSLYQNMDNSLAARASQLGDIQSTVDEIRRGEFTEEIGEVVLICFYENRKLVILSPRDVNLLVDDADVARAINGESLHVTTSTAEGEGVRALATPVNYSETVLVPRRPGEPPHVLAGEPMALVVGHATGDIEDALSGLLRTFLLAIPPLLLVATAGGVFLARRAMQPVGQIARTAKDIGEHDLSRRISVRTADELGELAQTLNDMIARLEKAFARQRQFTADASHELRAPLSIIQAESTLALQKEREREEYQRALETVAAETGRATYVVEQLLGLARMDVLDTPERRECVVVSGLVRELAEEVRALCREKGLELRLEQLEDGVVVGDARRLREALLNLMDNAVRYTPRGGIVTVSVRNSGQYLHVGITDTGIGIPTEDLPHVFDRFYRVDRARARETGGSGLGLSIAARILELHGGRIEVESQPNRGSTFRAWLPVAR